MEPRPLSDDTLATAELAEPHLELVPALDDPDAPEPEAAEEEDGPGADELEALETAAQSQDPLKLYVRSIGGGPLLTRLEERELARRKDAGDEAAKRRLSSWRAAIPCCEPSTPLKVSTTPRSSSRSITRRSKIDLIAAGSPAAVPSSSTTATIRTEASAGSGSS